MTTAQNPAAGGVRELVTTERICELYPAIKPRTLRYWLQCARDRTVSENGEQRTIEGNGLGRAVIRKGRLYLIDLALFNEWLYEGRVSA